MSLRALFCMTAIGLAFVAGAAQTPTPRPTPEEEVIKVNSRLIVVPVSVTDANGLPVTGLTAADFRVSEEGRQQTLENVGSADVVPLEIALLFDVSASTGKMFRFQQETAEKFLRDVMRPNDRASVFTIGQSPLMVSGRATSDQAVSAIGQIMPGNGATAFFDSIRAAADYLRVNAPDGTRRVIIVISDGEDNFSEGVQRATRRLERQIVDRGPDPEMKKFGKIVAQAQQSAKAEERASVLKALQDADIVHYSINPAGSSYALNQISAFGQENMQKFSDETGGTAFLPKFLPIDGKNEYENTLNSRRNGEMLDRIFNQLAAELRAQYLLQYYSEGEFAPNKYVRLEVRVPTRNGVRVRARRGYYVKN